MVFHHMQVKRGYRHQHMILVFVVKISNDNYDPGFRRQSSHNDNYNCRESIIRIIIRIMIMKKILTQSTASSNKNNN